MKQKITNYCLWCQFFLYVFSCVQAQAQLEINQVLSIETGLVNNEVTSIKQDKYGFLWIGTRGGLNKFDGYDLKLLRNSIHSKNNLSSEAVEVLYEGKNNTVWIGTKTGGLNSYNLLTSKVRKYPITFGNKDIKNIYSLYEDPKGGLYIGANSGLYYMNNKSNSIDLLVGGIEVNDIKPDNEGRLWLASNQGLILIKKNKKVFQTKFGKAYLSLTSLAIDRVSHTIYIGSWRNGLFAFDIGTQRVKQYDSNSTDPESLSNDNVFRLLLDKSRRLWIGTWGGGLNSFDIKTQKFSRHRFKVEDDLNNYDNKIVLSLEQDRSDILWIGTEDGVYQYNPRRKKFNSISYDKNNPASLSIIHIVSMLEDSNKALWVGTKDGALNYSKDHRHFQRFSFKNSGQYITRINCIFQDKQQVLIGSGDGLFILKGLDPTAERTIYLKEPNNPNSLSSSKVTCITKTREGILWLGTQDNGLNRLTGTSPSGRLLFKQYIPSSKPGAIQSERVSCLFNDKRGRLWVGTFNGLHLYNNNSDSFVNFRHQTGQLQSVSSNIILSITQDKDGNIWVGTQNGLNRLIEKDGKIYFKNYFAGDNLPSDYIHAILPGKGPEIWISTNKGLTEFNYNAEKFTNYDVRDGLSSNAFSENAAFIAKNGLMYFGSRKGIVFFHPDSIHINTIIPPVYFTNLSINNKSIKVGQETENGILLKQALFLTPKLSLSYRQEFISLTFAALDFHAPDKNQYAYRLKGFDDKWVKAGKTRTVTFTNLPPGDYHLEVIASNSDNVWNHKGAALEIKVLPPPWKTWWAYTIYMMILALLLWLSRHVGLNSLRLKNKLEIANISLQREREIIEIKSKLFNNISHEFRTPLTLIVGPLEDLYHSEGVSAGARKIVYQVQNQAKRLLNLVNQLLDFQKSENNALQLNASQSDLISFTRMIFDSFSVEARRRSIDFQLINPEGEILLDFDREKMASIQYNLLSNAFKFSPDKGCITIKLSTTQLAGKRFCELTVSDNGKGIKPEAMDKIFDRYYQVAQAEAGKYAGTGIGLAFVKELVALHEGTITVESEPGKGSTFHVLIPIKQEKPLFVDEKSLKTEEVAEPEPNDLNTSSDEETPIILVVEDNLEVNEYIVSILESNYNVHTAVNGFEGIEKAVKILPDLIISDVMMPVMTGFELCKTIKSDQRTSHIPVILLTARADDQAHIKGVNEGADVYLSKPFNPILLSTHVKNILQTRKNLKKTFANKVTLGPKEIEISSFEEEFLQKIITKIEENIHDPDYQTDSLADEMNMSRSTFYRKLKALTDMSGSEFIGFIRIKKSIPLLMSEKYAINQIAYEVGFNDPKNFRRYFQKHYQMTPTQYLQKMKETNLTD